MIPARPTPEQLSPATRARVCNGIGPAYGTSKASRVFYAVVAPVLLAAAVLGILDRFRSAGDQHDLDYAIGGTEAERIEGDSRFRTRCLKVALRGNCLLRFLRRRCAYAFVWAVGRFGWASFRYRPRSPYFHADGTPASAAELIALVTKEAHS